MSEKISNENDLGRLTRKRGSTPKKDDQIAKLESDLEEERRNRKLERFICFLVALTVFDVIACRDQSWSYDILIAVPQFVLMVVVGRFCGVTDIRFLVSDAYQSVKETFRPLPEKSIQEDEKPKMPEKPAASTPSTSAIPEHSAPPP